MSETLYCFSRLVVVGRVHRFPSFSEEFGLTQPFKGLNINGSLHMTIWTGVFIETFQAFGTTVRWASRIVLSAQDHAAAGITMAGTATVLERRLGDFTPIFLSLSTKLELFKIETFDAYVNGLCDVHSSGCFDASGRSQVSGDPTLSLQSESLIGGVQRTWFVV